MGKRKRPKRGAQCHSKLLMMGIVPNFVPDHERPIAEKRDCLERLLEQWRSGIKVPSVSLAAPVILEQAREPKAKKLKVEQPAATSSQDKDSTAVEAEIVAATKASPPSRKRKKSAAASKGKAKRAAASPEEEGEEEEGFCPECKGVLESEEMAVLKGMLPDLEEKVNLVAMLTDCDRDVERAANLYFVRNSFVLKNFPPHQGCTHWR